MGIIKTETFVNEEGVERRIDTYENGMTIEYDANEPEEETPQHSQLDRMEEKIDTLVSGTTSENTEAINAFLGV